MREQSVRDIYKEYFLCLNLYQFIRNDLSLYLYDNLDQISEDRLREYIDHINKILQHTGIDVKIFSNLLNEYIDQYPEQEGYRLKHITVPLDQLFRYVEERIPTPIETYILDYRRDLKEQINDIPNSLDKTKIALLGLISAYNPKYYSNQVYDAILALIENISPELVINITENWKIEALRHIRSGRSSRIFWISNVEYETIDMISRYRFKTQFNIREFEFAFKEVESVLDEIILDTRDSSSGSLDLWLISSCPELSYKLAGINIKLKGYVNSQHSDGYWRNGSRLDYTIPDIYTSALTALSFLKLSPSNHIRQSGIKGASWIHKNQNQDGSWSFQFLTEEGIKSKADIFTTILCLEVLKRSGLEGTEEVIEKGENWIRGQQNNEGMWNDDFLPFPFLTVLILEYFYKKDLFSHQLPLFQEELTPKNVILVGMRSAIEISKKCESEEGKISPKVGAVVINDDRIILEAYRGETSKGDHAEFIILEKKGVKFNFEDSILITTLEPCTFRSIDKIPCAKRIVDAGIKEVWVGILDPNPQIAGKAMLYLTSHGVSVGLFPPKLSKEIKDINTVFWDEKFKPYYEDVTDSQINIMATNKEEEK